MCTFLKWLNVNGTRLALYMVIFQQPFLAYIWYVHTLGCDLHPRKHTLHTHNSSHILEDTIAILFVGQNVRVRVCVRTCYLDRQRIE